MRYLTSSWQKRRGVFNHDWLKNQYMPALAKCLNLLDDKIEDRDFEVSFVSRVLPAWETHRDEALLLVQGFENEMSPQRLLDHSSLSRCDESSKQWLRDLTHALWLTRYPVRRWIEEMIQAIERADVAYDELQEALQTCSDVRSAEALRPLRKQFSTFRDQCQALASVLSEFPNEVKVV